MIFLSFLRHVLNNRNKNLNNCNVLRMRTRGQNCALACECYAQKKESCSDSLFVGGWLCLRSVGYGGSTPRILRRNLYADDVLQSTPERT